MSERRTFNEVVSELVAEKSRKILSIPYGAPYYLYPFDVYTKPVLSLHDISDIDFLDGCNLNPIYAVIELNDKHDDFFEKYSELINYTGTYWPNGPETAEFECMFYAN